MTDEGKRLNCYNNTVKVHVEDYSETYYALESVCPWYIGKQLNSTYVCCDLSQINTLKNSSRLAQLQLCNCPSCLQNFMNVFCAITCDPSNSLFMDVQKLDNDTTSIDTVGVYFTNYYTDKFFNSCKNVQSPEGCASAVSGLCGSRYPCTGQKWLQFMGTPQSSSPAAFTMNFTFTDNSSGGDLPTNISARNASLLNCNEPWPADGVTCSCSDCPAACPAMPTVPVDSGSLKISFIPVGMLFGVVSLVIYNIVFVIILIMSKSQRPVEQFIRPSSIKLSLRYFTNAGQKFRDLNFQLFSWWGRVTANHWYLVITAVLIVISACCSRLLFLEVTTDPVELWSVPKSSAQKEREYFYRIGDFYRPSQIIITAPNTPGFTFDDPIHYNLQYNASGIFRQYILNEVSIIYIASPQ